MLQDMKKSKVKLLISTTDNVLVWLAHKHGEHQASKLAHHMPMSSSLPYMRSLKDLLCSQNTRVYIAQRPLSQRLFVIVIIKDDY